MLSSVGFMNFNRNKRAIAVDLKQPEGREILSTGRRSGCICAQHAR